MAQSLTLLTLPSDMLYGILCYVPKEFLPTVFRICQKLGAVSKSEDFWHRYATTSFPPIELPAPHAPIYWKPEGESWKWYIRIHKDLGTRANHTGLGSKKKPYYLHALYRGEWKEGIRTGWGIAFMETKDVYIGYFDTNRRHGKGKFYCSNGDVFEGDHLEDAHTGFGIYRWANGNNYEGNFQKFKREGQGTFTEGKGGWKITGNWKDGFPADESGNNSLDYVLTRINPKVADAIKNNVCTFTVTGEDRYAQPFYELKAPEDGRPHGICVSCYNACKDKNSYKFTEPNSIFGGNFFCDCGAEIDKALKCHALGK